MTIKKDAQRYRKIYSYYRPQPRETLFGAGGGVDETVINGLDWKQSVRAATTANITLSPSPASIDGITLAPDDRVLVKDQATASGNGIYYYDSGTGDLVRSDDAVDPALTSAAAVFVEGGVTNGDCAFVLVTQDPITVGTTALSWVKFAGAGSSIFTSSVSPLLAKTIYSVSIDSDNRYANVIGDDVFFFVSGSITSSSTADHKAVFGGDVVVSGNLSVQNGMTVFGDGVEMTGSLTVTDGISGSLTKLSNGSSYLIAGTNITITSQSNGSILIDSTGGGGGGPSYFDSIVAGSIFTTGSAAFVDQETVTSPSDKGTDVFFYVSGSRNSKDGILPGISLFGGDVVVSGSFVGFGDTMEITGTLEVTNGISGSLTHLSDGTSYIVAGTNVTIVSQSNGSLLISSMGGGGSSFFDSTTDGSTYTTGSTAFIGGESSVDSPLDKGSDVFFYVSGSIGSQGTAVVGTALFGGDLVVSGAFTTDADLLELSGTLKVTNGISGSITQLTDGTSYLIAGNNVTITSGTNGSVTISNTFQQVDDYFDSTTSGSIYTTGSVAFRGDEASVDSPADKGADVFFYVSGSSNSKGTLTPGVALFGGDVTVSGSFFAEGSDFEITGTLAVTQGISGSLTKLTNGASYIIAGNNATVSSASNGSITLEAVPTSPSNSLQYNNGGAFGGSSNFTYNSVDAFLTGTFAAGSNARALGDYSAALGTGSTANAQYSLATGRSTSTDSSANFSHAEGNGSIAYGTAAHAEGYQTRARGDTSHSEGYYTEAVGIRSHSEGNYTVASGSYQHAEGSYNLHGNDHSILVIGNGTGDADALRSDIVRVEVDSVQITGSFIQRNSGSSAVGIMGGDSGLPAGKGTDVFFYVSGSTASARSNVSLFGGAVVISGSMVQGNFGASGVASGQYARAHGERSTASGVSSHSEGRFTLAQGANSHAEGDSTAAYGAGSHAEGLDSAAYAGYSHAEGRSTEARGAYSHAEGYDSIPRADYSHAEGRDTQTIAGALYSHAEGSGSIAVGVASHAEGLCTLASGSNQLAIGQYNLANNTESLFVVGNGTADAARSDVLRIDLVSVQASGSFSVSGSYSGNTNTMSGAGTIGSTGHSMLLTSTGAGDAVTLANGTRPGQLKYVVANSGYTAGNTSVITPTSALGYATVTFDANGDAVTFFWTGSQWVIVGSYGASIT